MTPEVLKRHFAEHRCILDLAEAIAKDRRILETATRVDLTADQIKVASPRVFYGSDKSAAYPWGYEIGSGARFFDASIYGDALVVDIVHKDGPQDSIAIPFHVFRGIYEEMMTWEGNSDALGGNWSGRPINTQCIKDWVEEDKRRLEAFYETATANEDERRALFLRLRAEFEPKATSE